MPARVVSTGQQRAAVPSGVVQCRPGPRPPSTDGAPRPAVGAPSTDQVGERWSGQSSGLLVRGFRGHSDLERGPGAVGSVGAGRGAVAQERRVVQPTAGVEKTNAIESPGDVQVLPSTVVDPMPAAVSPHRRCLPAGRRGKCPAIGCRSVTGIHRVAEQRWRAELRPPIYSHSRCEYAGATPGQPERRGS